MKKLLLVLLVIALLPTTAVHAATSTDDITRYHFDKICVTFSCEYTISLSDSDKAGWIAEIAGDSDLLHIMYSKANLYEHDRDFVNGVDIIQILGKNGERTFLLNGCNITGIPSLKLQLWSGITLDGIDVVKDYTKPLEIAYLELYFSPDLALTSIHTSFAAENVEDNRDGNGGFRGIYAQIGETKITDFGSVNYSGDVSQFSKIWEGIAGDNDPPFPIDPPPADVDPPITDTDKEPPADMDQEPIPKDRTDIADKLKELNLFLGTTTGYQLDSSLTRAQAATILVRLLGEEANVLQADYPNNPFTDVQDSHWAKNYILYCYENAITKGTSATTYAPERAISSKEFLTLLMRVMGYESEPVSSIDDCVKATLFGSAYADRLRGSENFIRGDVVDIMDKALKTPLNSDSEPVLMVEELTERDVFTREQAIQAKLMPNPEGDVLEQVSYFANNKLDL